jgi:hypothetical protein
MILVDTETGTLGYEQEIVKVLAVDGQALLAEATRRPGPGSSRLSGAIPARIVSTLLQPIVVRSGLLCLSLDAGSRRRMPATLARWPPA